MSVAVAFTFAFSNIVPATAVYAAELVAATPATPETPTLPSSDKSGQMTDSDKDIADKVNSASSDAASSSSNGSDSLAQINMKIYSDAEAEAKSQQQTNSTSATQFGSYLVQDEDGNLVTVTKNPCYESTESRCSGSITMSYKNDNSTNYVTLPSNAVEYITSNNTQITADMLEQIREQIQLTKDADQIFEGKGTNGTSGALNNITKAIATGNIDSGDAAFLAAIAQTNAMFNQQTIDDSQTYVNAVNQMNAAKNNVDNNFGEDAQLKRNTLTGSHTKRFDAVLSPALPTMNMSQDIKMTLKTSSGKQNDTKKVVIKATVQNQKSKKQETFDVLENVPFVVERAAWITEPGERTVIINYEIAGKSKVETYNVSYRVGNIVTGILENGKTVSNSVIGLVSTGENSYLNHQTYPVAGRITGAFYKDGVCYMNITDSKTREDAVSAVVTTTKLDTETCDMKALSGMYVSFDAVQADVLSDNSIIFHDVSTGTESNVIMRESDYDAIQDQNAKVTQDANDKYGSSVVREKDGIIYEGAAGMLAKEWTFINGTPVSVYNSGGVCRIAKSSGTDYSAEELSNIGLNPSNTTCGYNDDGTIKITDTNSHTVINTNTYTAQNVAAISKQVVYDRGDMIGSDTTTVDSLVSGAVNRSTGNSSGYTFVNGVKSAFYNGTKTVVSGLSTFGTGLGGTIAGTLSGAINSSSIQNKTYDALSAVMSSGNVARLMSSSSEYREMLKTKFKEKQE